MEFVMEVDAIDLMENAAVAPTARDLEAVKFYAKELVRLENEIEDGEALIAKLKKEREEIRRLTLPQLMIELGVDAIVANNHECRLEPLVTASLPKDVEQRASAISWLVDHGHGGIVKRELKVDLPKGDDITENTVRDAVQDAAPNLLVDVAYNVHHSSYQALARQLVRDGESFPADLLNVFIGQIVKVSEG
jgi:hypothetical protein